METNPTRSSHGSAMEDMFTRTRLLFGDSGMHALQRAKVAVFGLGGVGSYVVEALARSGVGNFILVDSDIVAPSNLNRQLIATVPALGELKTVAQRERIAQINPNAHVDTYPIFYEQGTDIPWDGVDYAVDAVDTVTAKILIVLRAREHGVPVISSMGTGNKVDPSKLRAVDIYETSVDPLARVMRREMRKRGVASLRVVYSTEEPATPKFLPEDADGHKIPSNAFVPGAAGLLLASIVVQDLVAKSAPENEV